MLQQIRRKLARSRLDRSSSKQAETPRSPEDQPIKEASDFIGSLSAQHTEALSNWDRDGFAVLRGFFDPEALDRLDSEVSNLMTNRSTLAGETTIDVLEGPLAGKRLRLSEAPPEALSAAHKVNDLYLESEACRHLNLNPELRNILSTLLTDNPLVINSLSFRKGSQQPLHFDSYFMPPPVKDQMVVSSICLEDQSLDTGPVSYFPGSHKIEPYVFSHGGIHALDEEMEQATAYVEAELDKHGLAEETFVGEAGDVLLWHGQLYHGGSIIKRPDLTRKTLVTHYWRQSDIEAGRVAEADGGGHYLLRDHQAV